MFETDIRKIDFGGKNIVKSHHVNLDTDLDCVMVLSSKDEKLSELLYHKIVDAIIDRIHPKNVYKDFSTSLENINAFLATWRHEDDKIKGLHGIIGISYKKTFLFSTLGSASCYLYNTHEDLIEVTDKVDTPREFSFISSGDIADREVLILSTIRLLDILSQDDIRDGLSSGSLKRSGENIEHILLQEHSGKNIGLLSWRRELQEAPESKIVWEKTSYYFLRVLDNSLTKKTLGYFYHVREKLVEKSHTTKQVLLIGGIIVSIFFLYTFLSGFFQIASNSQGTQEAKLELLQAEGLLVSAGENLNNPDVFTFNTNKAQDIMKGLEERSLFLEDLNTLKDKLGILQKQFNGVETFEINPENTMYSFPETQKVVKVVSVANKIYIVHEKSISGPMIQGNTPETYVFTEMGAEDRFIDASVSESNIVLMTQAGKVVNFAKNNYFSYADVLDQATWEKSPLMYSYSTHLYLLSDSQSQILRHKKQGTNYKAGESYLTDVDAASIGKILSIAIDGGIYILKQDGSLLKLFRDPKYRLESLVLNKLPKNYNFPPTSEKKPSLRAKADLKYIYMLLDNKILVFQPNTNRYQDVKSLLYLGQIEGKDTVIEDFHVENDGELTVASQSGVYKVKFEVIEDRVVLR